MVGWDNNKGAGWGASDQDSTAQWDDKPSSGLAWNDGDSKPTGGQAWIDGGDDKNAKVNDNNVGNGDDADCGNNGGVDFGEFAADGGKKDGACYNCGEDG
jgi:hypothetical protein